MTATRRLRFATISASELAHVALPKASCPRAWRWSNRTIRASTPSSPSFASRDSSVGSPMSGVGVELPVAGVEDVPGGVRIASALGSGIEWASGDELDVERPDA